MAERGHREVLKDSAAGTGVAAIGVDTSDAATAAASALWKSLGSIGNRKGPLGVVLVGGAVEMVDVDPVTKQSSVSLSLSMQITLLFLLAFMLASSGR